VLTFGVLGVECAEYVELTCAGCRFNLSTTEYFCPGIDRYILFRCESLSIQQIWNVSPLFDELVTLGPTSKADNIIHRNGVNIVVDTVDIADAQNVRIISNLLLNLGELTSNVTVSCDNRGTQSKTFKTLDSVTEPTSVVGAV
jgi:hypothetical protein